MRVFIALISILILFSCTDETKTTSVFEAEAIHTANRKLIEISIEDIYSPPVATRVFAYPNLVAYEILMNGKGKSIIKNFITESYSPTLSDTLNIDYSIAAMHAYGLMAKKLVFSEYMADSIIAHFRAEALSKNVSNTRLEKSIEYANTIFDQINPWLNKDNYAKVKSDDFYTIRGHDSTWVLTPPNYEQALEPNWKNLRTLVIGDVKKFQPIKRPAFSTDKNSAFYKEAMKVYQQGNDNQDSTKGVAKHWDCNPNEFIQKGHNVTFNHRISPPGHWIGITKALCDATNADLEKSMLAYASITTAMFDGVISCWYTKYTEELIRPVTYINKYIDNTWKPYIQTPPFPEYTSGHSVVSGCSSSILELLFPKTAFVDYTEVEFGLPARSFASVHDAGEEASLSRYFGGIHYRFGVDNGLEQGRKIGKEVLSQLTK